jgi:tetraacyldisaccharide 4'-kinase
MDRWLQRIWYGDRGGAWLLPLTALFALGTALRRQLYRSRLLPTRRARPLVVVIGNLSVGGTGKTPLTLWLAARLRERGLRVGIVSRGHGGRSGAARRVPVAASAAEFGDEPVLIARRRLCPVAVGYDRAAAVALLGDDVDGLQHYALARDVEIAVVDGARGLGNGRLLPAGPLREGAWRLATVDAVVVNGAGFDHPGALRMELVPGEAVALGGGSRRPLTDFLAGRVHAVAAIGHPERFFALLRSRGLAVVPQPLPDHADWRRAGLGRGGETLLMTEKDAVKSRADGPADAWYVPVEACFAAADAARLLAVVDAALARRR